MADWRVLSMRRFLMPRHTFLPYYLHVSKKVCNFALFSGMRDSYSEFLIFL